MADLTVYEQKVLDVRTLLGRMKGQIEKALPRHMTPDRLMRIALTSCTKTPKLLDCDRGSLAAAVMQSAALGLEPDGALGEAYLIPYGKQVQLQAGFKGLIKLARNSGLVTAVGANVVRKRDLFRWSEGPQGTFEHVPYEPDVPDDATDLARDEGTAPTELIAGPMTHAYAWAKLRDGSTMVKVMRRHEVLAIRARSQAWGNYLSSKTPCPWVTDPEPMWKKTAIKQLMKICPQSPELARAIALDGQAEAGMRQDFGDVIDTTATIDDDAPKGPKSTADLTKKTDPDREHLDAINRASDEEQVGAALDMGKKAPGTTGALDVAAKNRREQLRKGSPQG